MVDIGEKKALEILQGLASTGVIEFASSRGPNALAEAFAELLEREKGAPSGRQLCDWFLEQPEVAEVFADDDALEQSVKQTLAHVNNMSKAD